MIITPTVAVEVLSSLVRIIVATCLHFEERPLTGEILDRILFFPAAELFILDLFKYLNFAPS